MAPTSSPRDQEQDQEIKRLLENLESLRAEYPPELLAARRAAFVAKVKNIVGEEIREEQLSSRQLTQRLRELQSVRTEYPPNLLAARRNAFAARVQQLDPAEVKEELLAEDQDLLRLLRSIKLREPQYPPELLAARRAAFVRQVALGGRISLLETWWSRLRRLVPQKPRMPSLQMPILVRAAVSIAILIAVAFVVSVLRTPEPVFQAPPDQEEVVQPAPILATNTKEAAEVICRAGYLPPLCLAREFERAQDLTYQGNGVARPAVAKDTVPGYSGVHNAAYVNDGLYGPGSSWVSNSAYSWIKIDLGKPTTINTVTFGRDRLGHLQDRNPGQFVIAVALADNIYADGNSSNDYIEYTQVYHSNEDGFSGVISGSETVEVAFAPVLARYVKIIFANPGTTVDEVEVFMLQPPVLAESSTRRERDEQPGIPATPVPSNTPIPSNTPSPIPTTTPTPADTSTPKPTSTPRPTNTATPIPTNTARPTNTPTAIPTNTPRPTNTATPPPTSTPRPTNTPTEVPTDTPLPPTNTPPPVPTDTPRPTSTPLPPPTDTPLPTNTPVAVVTEPTIGLTETPFGVVQP